MISVVFTHWYNPEDKQLQRSLLLSTNLNTKRANLDFIPYSSSEECIESIPPVCLGGNTQRLGET